MDDEVRGAIQKAMDSLMLIEVKTHDPRLEDLVSGMREELHEFMVEEGGLDEAQD